MNAAPLRIAVISRRALIAEALCEALADLPNGERLEVVADESGLRAAATWATVWLIDLDEPGPGFTVLTRQGEETATRRLGFYDEFTTAHASEAFELGITSLVPLTATIEQFKAALLTRGGASSATVGEGPSRSELARLKLLTSREVEVLQHLALGRRTRTIGALLGITAHTVAAHKRRIFAKLDAQHDAQVVSLAVRAGLVPDEPA